MDDMFFKPARNKLSEIIKEFIYARKAERYSPHTIREYATILGKFERFTGGDAAFADIDAGAIRHFLGSLPDTLADKTVCNYHIALSSLWTFAVKNGYADEHIVRKVNTPRYAKARVVPFTEAEIQKIYHACRYIRDKAVVMILTDTGLRANEIINLKIGDWQERSLRVVGKGKKIRVVPISKPTEWMIESYLRTRKVRDDGIDGGEYLITNVIGGGRLTYDGLRSLMDRLEEYSCVPNVHAHRFRHTFAIWYLRNGGDIYTLQKILGHATLDMVKNYLDIVRSDMTEAHERASPVMGFHLGGRSAQFLYTYEE